MNDKFYYERGYVIRLITRGLVLGFMDVKETPLNNFGELRCLYEEYRKDAIEILDKADKKF